MTLSDFYQKLENYDFIILIYCLFFIVLTFIIGKISGKGKDKIKPWKQIYSVIIYSVTLPGLLQTLLVFYLLFIEKKSLMDFNIIIYFVPILTMILTLFLISKTVNLKTIPGFDKLSGLILMLGASILIVLIISKTRIWLFFGGSIYMFFGLIIVLFLIIKLGAKRLTKKTPE